MTQGFRVRYRSNDGSVQGEDVVTQLPIRLGRNERNHCRIVDRFVSDFHAQIELVDGKLCVRDLHSRNGIYSLSGERVGVGTPFELDPPDHAFVLGHLVQVQVEVFEQGRDRADERPPRSVGAVLGNPAMLRRGDSQPLGHPARLPGASLPGLTPPEPGYNRPAAVPAGPSPPRTTSHATQHFQMGIDTLAYLGLKELAGSLVPGAELETTGDVARLITKLHDAVEVFCHSFVPLREGYLQFVQQRDLRLAPSPRTANRSASALRVESAKDPAALAAALLDWRNQDYDVPQVVEGNFADLMIHQVAMIDSVMHGVHALLQELSPEKIERAVQGERSSVPALLGRYRALWQAFEKRYEEISNETRTFDVVFGAEFASAYRDHVARQRSKS
jgi:predicted component of type VI protein secretion system